MEAAKFVGAGERGERSLLFLGRRMGEIALHD